MFNIKEITVTASCSKQYQKAEFTMTCEVEDEEDIKAVKEICRVNALDLLNTLPIHEEPVKSTPQKQFNKPQYQPNNGYTQNRQVYQPVQSQQPRPASEKQMSYLQNAFGYIPTRPLTFEEANDLLIRYKNTNK